MEELKKIEQPLEPQQVEEKTIKNVKTNKKIKIAKELLVFLIVLNIGILFSLLWVHKKLDNIPDQVINNHVNKEKKNQQLENNNSTPQKVIIDSSQKKLPNKSIVYFKAAQKELNPIIQKELFQVLNNLEKNPNLSIEIVGHTDDEGSANNNFKISILRAELIANYLIDLGIEEERIKVTGYGEYYPIADNATVEGRDKNRRVEIIFKN